MKAIIAGSRTMLDYELVKNKVNSLNKDITTVISGYAKGVDLLGERYAKENDLPVIIMKADWERYGFRAGFIRNEEMALECAIDKDGICIVIWDGKSKGSLNMIKTAKKYNLELFVFDINDNILLDINKL